jgi:N-acetylglucosaminyl-diphospho-decaprenol L-rhamnosyltransferase
MTPPRFSFLIVTYNNAETVEPCLSSIAAWTADSYEIVVVDNSPNDETLSAVRRFMASHSQVAVRVLQRHENIGFSRACNRGADQATGEFLFFLNPDTQLLNDAGKLLAHCLEKQPGALAAGPAVFDGAGRVSRTCRKLPNLGRILLDATGVDNWCGVYKLTRFGHDVPKQVEQIIGAAILVRRSDYEKFGGMDEQFFVYFEEVDFCKRLRDAGGDIWFWPEARVQHLGGGSCEASPVRARMIFVLRESRRKYFIKHFGVISGVALEVVNRLEGIQKAAVLAALWMLRRKRTFREKAYGFWAVATGIAPQV